MKVHELSFYSKFQCAMGSCPNTCCHGWQIVLDHDTVQKYMEKKGRQGLWLRSSLTSHNGAILFKGSRRKCPFLSKDLLCKIQLSLGEEYLSDVCRIFPRQRINYGYFAEESLFLACPQVCRLFLNNLDHLCYKTTDRNVSYAKSGTNDDAEYLQELVEIRLALTEQIMNHPLPRPMLYTGLLSYAKALQQSYIANYALSDGSKSSYFSKPVHTDLAAHIREADTPFIIPHDITYAMLTGSFYHIFLKMVSPFLYSLCRTYLKEFKWLTSAKGDTKLSVLLEQLYVHHPNTERILRGYLTYYLLEKFLTVYEDYSFLHNIATGIMHTHLLELFFALYHEKNHRLTDDDIIRIITVYNRRGRHNDEIETEMYEKLKRFLDAPAGKQRP